ncbi:MAG: hypothetical protein IJ225_11655 [Solobacterium sp.]|nr:hypothetical protein [Solobacterium sp.]
MAGSLMFLSSGWEGIGYYIQNWNTDAFSIGCVLVLALIISGYFYGCVFRKFIRPLEDIDCTLLGVFTILALFQILVFVLVSVKGSTDIAYYVLAGIFLLSPILCLLTWSNVVPSWKHLASLILGILITGVLVYGSMNLNTNNIYFDSITYLSEVIESSKNEIFAHILFPNGAILRRVDPLHDYTGYYYFWGILLRWAENLFHFKDLTTPIYIWGATVLYGMTLGMLTVSSACALFKKWAWKGVLFTTLFMAPFYTNYFNTTLAFFGNTIRTVVIGTCVLLVYLILSHKNSAGLFIPLMLVYFAGLNVSSSSLFLIAFITAGLFFALAITKEKHWLRWAGLILTLTPLIHMVLLVFFNESETITYPMIAAVTIGIVAVLILISFLLRKWFDKVDIFFSILFPIALLGLIAMSYLSRNGDYGYSYFFRSSSLDDMTVNMTSHLSQMEFIRNIVFYVLLALTLVNFKVQRKFKLFLVIVVVLFINPLVQPAVSRFFTAGVYSRVFDLLNNPFTLCFLLYSLDRLIPLAPLSYVALLGLGAFGAKLGYDTLTTPYSKSLEVGTDNWNWEAKVSNDSYELYEYINNALASQDFDIREREYDHRVSILSQDAGLKGYVTGINILFSTEDYRSALAGTSDNRFADRMIALMYPDRMYTEDDYGDVGDFSKLGELFQETNADYVVINNTLALWDERGWFYSPYDDLITKGMCAKIFENESWAVLRINKDYVPAGKHPDRYWVHKYEDD